MPCSSRRSATWSATPSPTPSRTPASPWPCARSRATSSSSSVTDQGQGIAAADQQRIFERFYRVDAARSRATGGTGLGLAIVKHVAANHGGEVTVWSEPGRGSTFTAAAPLDDASAASATPTRGRPTTRSTSAERRPVRRTRPSALSPPGAQPPDEPHAVSRILVVEDEESFSDPLSYLLRRKRATRSPSPRPGPTRSPSSTRTAPTSSCSTSCCPACPASTCAGSCASAAPCRSSC